jgi:hypothetical protein
MSCSFRGSPAQSTDLDAATRVKVAVRESMRGVPAFDEHIHDEAVDLFLLLAPATFAERSTVLLNAPTIKDRLNISAAIRALGNSAVLHYLVPTAITTTRLYYLVAFLEGVVMPQLRTLLALCEQQGYVGRRRELKRARTNLGPAFTFLAGPGASTFRATPRLSAEINWVNTNRIPQLRNAVAHFHFRLEEAVQSANEIPSVAGLGPLGPVGLRAMQVLAKVLRLPAFDPESIPNYQDSFVQYEEDLSMPILPLSRKRTYVEVRETLQRIERFGMSMMLAALSTGNIHQREGRLRLGSCSSCRVGLRVGLPGAAVTCPWCGTVWAFH